MSLSVALTRKAALDIARTFNWLAENRSSVVAFRWRIELEAAFRKLATDAPGCPEAPEAEWVGANIRQYLHGRPRNIYRILFRIRNETVQVLRVRHARQDFLGPDDL